jgi:autotransporter-associated beta strand protein
MKPCLISRLVLLTVAANTANAAGTPITWADLTGNTDWTSSASWTGGVAPTDNITTDAAIFTNVANAQPHLDVAARSVTGIDFQLPAGGVAFTSIAGATLTLGADGIDATTQTSGTSTVNVENVKLGAASTWTIFSNVTSTTTSTFSVGSNIDLNAKNLTVASNRNSASGNVGIVNLSGAISGNATVSLNGNSASRNTINLTGNSSYTGTTNIQATVVTANSLANAGINSALGSSGTVVVCTNSSFANLVFQNLTVDGTTDRLISTKGTGGGILTNNDADNTLSFTNAGNTVDTSVTGNAIFTLQGTNTGNNTFAQVINDRSGGVTNFKKENAGTWVLTADNTYTGTTSINAGTLQLGDGATTGSLNPASVITNNGTLAFKRSDNLSQGTHFSGNPITGTGALTKNGSGSLSLTAANTYTGVTTVNAGTVNLSGDHSAATGGWTIRGNTAASTVNFQAGSMVSFASGKSVTLSNDSTNAHTLNVAGTVTGTGSLNVHAGGRVNIQSGGTWTQNGNLTIQPLQSFSTPIMTVMAGGSFTYAGTSGISLSSSINSNGGSATLNLDGGIFTTGNGFNNTTTSSATAGSANLNFSNGGTLKLSADIPALATTAGRPFNVQVGVGGGIVHTNGFSTTLDLPITGAGGLTKAGAGTLTTTGINSYTGDTTVTGGTLSVAGPDFDDESAISIASGATLNLNFAGTDTVGALTINNVALADGVYSSATHPAFITGSGTLTVVTPVGGFDSWASGFGLTGNPDADFDKDGLADATEYVLGTSPTAANSSGITGQKSGGNFVFIFNRADEAETSDITLTVQAGTTLASWPQSFTVGATTAASSAGVVVTENGAAADTVTVTIPTSAAVKLFARLKVDVSGS